MRLYILLLVLLLHHGQVLLSNAYPPTQPPGDAPVVTASYEESGGGAMQPYLVSNPSNSGKSSRTSASTLSTVTAATKTSSSSAVRTLAPKHLQPAIVFKAAVPQLEEATATADASNISERESESSKKIIGSSVVTSVSVVLNGNEPQFTDAMGHKVPKPEPSLQVASPINLLNPDRYEFFTFDDNGELVKRLMTMQEIQSIVANGDGEGPSIIHTAPVEEREPEKNVQDIVNSVQSVLNKQVESKKNVTADAAPLLDTPDVSTSWSMILPAIFGNTGDNIFPHQKPQQIVMTPDSELLENSTQKPTRSTKKPKPPKRKPGQKRKTTTVSPSTTARVTELSAQTPQVVQEELDPHESVYTGIQQYQSIASNMQNFDGFSVMNLQPTYHSPSTTDDPETTTRRVFVNNQEMIQTTGKRKPVGTTTMKPEQILNYVGKKPTSSQQSHAPPHRNKNPDNGSHPRPTRRPGTTHHKQKIKKKPTTTTTAPESTTVSTTTTEPATTTTSTTPEPTTTTTPEPPTTTTPEPTTTTTTTTPVPTTSTVSTTVSPIPSSTTSSASTPTKKKKKPSPHPDHHPSASTQKPHSSTQKPSHKPHRPRPSTTHHPVHDLVAESTGQQEVTYNRHQQHNHHKHRPKPTKPIFFTTTRKTTTTPISTTPTTTATTSAPAMPTSTTPAELIVESFPGFEPTITDSTTPSTTATPAPPTFAPVPAYSVPPSYVINRPRPQQQLQGVSEETDGSSLKIQPLPSFSIVKLNQNQQHQTPVHSDEDQNTKLSFDQIMQTLQQDESQKLENISENKKEKPIIAKEPVLTAEATGGKEEVIVDIRKPLPETPTVTATAPSNITSGIDSLTPEESTEITKPSNSTNSISALNEEKDLSPVVTIKTRPQLSTSDQNSTTTTQEFGSAEPSTGSEKQSDIENRPEFEKDEMMSNSPEIMNNNPKITTKKPDLITTVTLTQVDPLTKLEVSDSTVDTIEKEDQEFENDPIIPTTIIPQHKVGEENAPGDIDRLQNLYAEISDPIITELTTTEILETQTSGYSQEEPTREDLSEAEFDINDPLTVRDSDFKLRIPVTRPEKVEEGNTEQPLVTDLKPYLNLNVIEPTEKISMANFQTQAATVASALIDGTNTLPTAENVMNSNNDTKDELEFLMSDVIQQITDNEPPYKLSTVQKEDSSNRLTNFAQLNTSFLFEPTDFPPLSSHVEAAPLYNETDTLPDEVSVKLSENNPNEEPNYDNSTAEEFSKPKISQNSIADAEAAAIIPNNEELIRKEEEYLSMKETTTVSVNNNEEIDKDTSTISSVASLPQTYEQVEVDKEAQYEYQRQELTNATEATFNQETSEYLTDKDTKEEENNASLKTKEETKSDTVGTYEETLEKFSSEVEAVELTKSEEGYANGTSIAIDDNGQKLEIQEGESLIPELSEGTTTSPGSDEAYTTLSTESEEDTTQINSTGLDFTSDVTAIESNVENQRIEDTDIKEDSALIYALPNSNDESEVSEETEQEENKSEEENKEKDTESDSVINATRPQLSYVVESHEKVGEAVGIESQEMPSELHAGDIVTQVQADVTKSTDLELKKDLEFNSQKLQSGPEKSSELPATGAVADLGSEIAESLEETTHIYEDAMRTSEEVIEAATSDEPTATISSDEVDESMDSLKKDPYVKLGEATAKPTALFLNRTEDEKGNPTSLLGSKTPAMNLPSSEEDPAESAQPTLMENNYENIVRDQQGIYESTHETAEQDEEDEEDQGGGFDVNISSSSIVTSSTTTTTTKATTSPPRPSRMPTTTTTTTKRLNTLKPVSYFKQPVHNSYGQQAEPMKPAYSVINPPPPPPSPNQSQQQQQQRPMQRPPSLTNLMHTSAQATRPPVRLEPSPENSKGLEASTANLDNDLLQFTHLCNELAFSYWKSITSERISSARSLVISPFALTSMLSMVFLGARGGTSGEMNEVLKLDDMVTFNPHLVFKNVTDSVERATDSNIATAAFVREIFSDRANGKVLQFFKEKTQQLYSGHVEEVNFHVVSDIIRRRTNLLMKRHTMGKVLEYLRTNSIWVNGPLATISANLFQTDCSHGSTVDRDGEMFFQVHPSVRQRRLVPIPAVLYRSGFTAGYEPKLDATVVAFGSIEETVSSIYLMPGHQSSISLSDNLDRLERQLVQVAFRENAWSNVLTSLMDRPGMEVQLPRFSHRSFVNASLGLQKMGLRGLFQSDFADLRGLTGSSNRDIYLSDMVQINTFSTCGEDKIADHHHVEMYPAPPLRKRNKDVANDDDDDGFDSSEAIVDFGSLVQDSALGRGFYDDLLDPKFLELPLPLRPRQARVPDATPRLRFDKPFLYFVRHNPTGLILFMGRFNPRLLP